MILKIAVLSGDGIGPEVTQQSLKVLKALGRKFNHKIELESGLVGAVAIDKYGDPYPDQTHQVCLNSDAVLFGAIGDPKHDNDPKAKEKASQKKYAYERIASMEQPSFKIFGFEFAPLFIPLERRLQVIP